jgi:hypothetical protein
VLCETSWQLTNGWPRALQTCKGEEKEMQLDKDKKTCSKAKEVCGFWIAFVVDWVGSRAYKSE